MGERERGHGDGGLGRGLWRVYEHTDDMRISDEEKIWS